MGNLILCTRKTAKQPFLIQPSGFPIYSLEELCYYMEQNFYLLDKSLFGHDLIVWLGEEIQCMDLAADLERSLRQHRSLYPSALLILKRSCLYTEEELRELEELFEGMDGKTVMECRKMKADQYLAQERYALAVAEYSRLLQKENLGKMTDELRGAMYHNKGVAYARMFLFPEASECFLEAYRQNQRPESREAYLFAVNYMKDGENEDAGTELHLNFDTMKEAFDKFQEVSKGMEYFEERKKVADCLDAAGKLPRAEKQRILESWKKKYRDII